jgi:rhamnosyltransferase
MPEPRVSILIPTLDAERYLDRLLRALAGQIVEGGHEVRVIDSDSGDCTRQRLRAAGIHVTRIERAEFQHSATRNRLASEARGELLVFLSQDALPVDEHFLAELVAPFNDERVAGCTSRILPNPGDDPLTARTVLDAYDARSDPEVRELAGADRLDGMPAGERATFLRFNNVASCIRRSVLESLPFPDVPFGEDSAWAERALFAGHRIAFAPKSVVYHAHTYTPGEAFERYRVDAAFQRRIHGHRVRPNLASVLKGVASELRRDFAHVGREGAGPQHLLRAPALRTAQVLGQYFGSRGWALGWRPGTASGATRKFI